MNVPLFDPCLIHNNTTPVPGREQFRDRYKTHAELIHFTLLRL